MDSNGETDKKPGIDYQQNRWLDAIETLTEAQVETLCERFTKVFIEPFEIKNKYFQVNINNPSYEFFTMSLISLDDKKYNPKFYEKTNSLLTNSNLKSMRTKLKYDFYKQNPNMKFRHALETGLICDIRDNSVLKAIKQANSGPKFFEDSLIPAVSIRGLTEEQMNQHSLLQMLNALSKKIPLGPNKKGLSCKTKSTVEKLFSRFSLLLYKIRHDVRSTYIFNRTQGEDQKREVEQGTHLSFAMSEVSVAHDPSNNPKKRKKTK